MSLIPINLDDVQEPKPVANGRYPLQITGAELTETGPNSKSPGSPIIKVSLGFTGGSKAEQNAPNVTHFVSLPNEMDEEKSANFKSLLLKRFLVLFNIPFNSTGIDTEELAFAMVGQEADVEVTLGEPDDNGSVYNRLVIPRIRGE